MKPEEAGNYNRIYLTYDILFKLNNLLFMVEFPQNSYYNRTNVLLNDASN